MSAAVELSDWTDMQMSEKVSVSRTLWAEGLAKGHPVTGHNVLRDTHFSFLFLFSFPTPCSPSQRHTISGTYVSTGVGERNKREKEKVETQRLRPEPR